MGVRLFGRQHRAVTLTIEGENYYRELSGVFAQVDRATRRLSRRHTPEVLNIQAYTTFAMRWLIPRLTRFQARHPDIHVHLTASLQPVDFMNSDIHCAIRAGNSDWPCRAEKICETYVVPVCSPEVCEKPRPLKVPKDLVHSTLLHSRGRPLDWGAWFQAVEMPEIGPEEGHRFESSSMAYEAALRGMGVAVGQMFLVEEELRTGKLVMPFDTAVHFDETYYFLTSPRYVGVTKLEMFREWILSEARSTNTGRFARDLKISEYHAPSGSSLP